MRIQVKGYLALRGLFGDQPSREISTERITVRELVQHLALELGDEFSQAILDPETGGIRPRIAVLVNGRHCSHLPAGLDTELRDGDEVAIFPPLMGG